MRRLLASLMLIITLSVPVFSGHVPVGGGRYCDCAPVEGYCPCCGGILNLANNQEAESISQHMSDCTEPAINLGLIRLALLTWLKIRA